MPGSSPSTSGETVEHLVPQRAGASRIVHQHARAVRGGRSLRDRLPDSRAARECVGVERDRSPALAFIRKQDRRGVDPRILQSDRERVVGNRHAKQHRINAF